MLARDRWLEQLRTELAARQSAHLLRTLQAVEPVGGVGEGVPAGTELSRDGRTYLQFCSNNYLGLAADPEVIAAAREATARWGAGSGSSRLVAGSMAIHHDLETALARFKRTEAALLFSTGFMANL